MRLTVGSVEHDLTSRALVMGIVNTSPESAEATPTATEALARARRLVADGADIIDIGAVSGRGPAVDVESEIARLVPALEVIRANVSVPISVDTSSAVVLAVALAAGAVIANDVSGFSDLGYLEVAANVDATVIATARPISGDVSPLEAAAKSIQHLAAQAVVSGVSPNRVIVDAGLGLGKSDAASLALLRNTAGLAKLGYPLLVAASRKPFLGSGLGQPGAEIGGGGLGAVALAIWHGARIVRTHDVREARRVADVVGAIVEAA
ncbi:MAG TPA: dihydropteroate synthase [Acidimicrobiales bacterium]|nr:dihydropteroate synthase [Acidimicrobiales bacterium]